MFVREIKTVLITILIDLTTCHYVGNLTTVMHHSYGDDDHSFEVRDGDHHSY